MLYISHINHWLYNMAIIEKGKCKIEYLDSNGLGVAKAGSGYIHIPYTIEGEIVEFELHKYRSESQSILKGIVTSSEDRIIPICSYFGACGGCSLQHIKNDKYNKLKLDIISKALDKYKIQTEIKPLMQVPISSRRRAFLKAVKKEDKIFLGFNRFHSNQIINIDNCPILIPPLSDLIPHIKTLFGKILENKDKASIGITMAANGIDFYIESNFSITDNKIKKLSDFGAKYTTRLQIISNEQTIKIFEKEAPYVIFGTQQVNIDTKSFLQATLESDLILSKIVNAQIKPNSKIVDLFCGLGTLSLALIGNFVIDGFEANKDAIEILTSKNIPNTKFQTRNLYQDPLPIEKLQKYQYAIINPPRLGAKKQCLELSNSNIEKIIYVSCNPETFARDAKILSKKYKLLEVIPLDQFYYSSHIEIIGIFSITS